jgi:NNP family nitrate/nitrite transporter-like MFS transporter
MLALATVGFAVTFWAWNLISPLGSHFADKLSLSPLQTSLLVAVPVLVGSLGRIPAGVLTDRFGARVMFPLLAAITILPVLFTGLFGTSYAALLVGGFFLGIGGTTFAVGVPFVNAWFPPERRGTAIGIFGAGTVGTAVSAFTTVHISDALGSAAPFLIVAVVLAVFAVASWFLLENPPGRPTSRRGSALAGVWATLRRPVTWQLALLYALGFGGFVAFSVYLPTNLINAYGLTAGDAALRTAGFVVLAVVARPVGGWLSDRFHPVPVLLVCFVGSGLFALLAGFELQLLPAGTVAYLGLAMLLGAAAGAVFALVSRLVEPAAVGSVTGVVGAAGGLGGFVPPLVMGSIYGATGSYQWGLFLLALACATVALFTWRVFGHGGDALPATDEAASGTLTDTNSDL